MSNTAARNIMIVMRAKLATQWPSAAPLRPAATESVGGFWGAQLAEGRALDKFELLPLLAAKWPHLPLLARAQNIGRTLAHVPNCWS